MNIFASLKMLLLPAATGGSPPVPSAAPPSGDFAALLAAVDQGAATPATVDPAAPLPQAMKVDQTELRAAVTALTDAIRASASDEACAESASATRSVHDEPVTADAQDDDMTAPDAIVLDQQPTPEQIAVAAAVVAPVPVITPPVSQRPSDVPATLAPLIPASDGRSPVAGPVDPLPQPAVVTGTPDAPLAIPVPPVEQAPADPAKAAIVVGAAPAAPAAALSLDRPPIISASAPLMAAPPVMPAASAPLMAAPLATPTAPAPLVDAPLATAAPSAPAQPAVQAPFVSPVRPESAQPIRSEALSLLQLVSDQITRRPVKPERAAAATPRVVEAAPDSMATMTTTVPLPALASPSAAVLPSPVSPPLPDVGGTLATRVVDMGVQGQWIDGLARDIAGLSAHGAQGRFEIRSDQLGPVQVDIRQGVDGTDVSMTVASDAAVAALRQDSDRLRSDAALSSLRIADLRIERAPTPADATRSDGGGQPGGAPSQNGTSGGGMTSGGMNSGGSSQGMGQGRPQARDNFTAQHKAAGDPAVLNHVDAREIAQGGGRTAGRARYA